MLMNIILIIILLAVQCTHPVGVADYLESAQNRFDKSAAQKNNAQTKEQSTSNQKPTEKKEPIIAQEKKFIGKPILAKHKQFSDRWWKELFGNCKECPNFAYKVDCKKMLETNKVWQEVEVMNAKAKQIVMRTALDNLQARQYDNHACIVACALCAGGDPNERMTIPDCEHTALHAVTSIYMSHKGLFSLVLEKGADPEALCIPAHPREFTPDEWKPILEEYISKKKMNQEQKSNAA